jgi:triacylglycerol lipase
MGSLNTRWYIKFVAGGQEKVDDWVSLGGPNHGTEAANICFGVTCEEMRIGSKFLSELNAGDETPGTVNYGTWWSPCDEFINPDESVILSGATNTKTACMSHLSLVSDETVYKQVREFVK